MELEIIKIHEQGKQISEFVELKVLADCELKFYMIADQTYLADKSLSNKLRNTYWFKPMSVKKGDLIFLRTCKGTNSSSTNTAGKTTHIVFWGLEKPVWNNTGDTAVLIRMREWNSTKA